jgi:hypothetical protein
MAGGAKPAASALPELLGTLPAYRRAPICFGVLNAKQETT